LRVVEHRDVSDIVEHDVECSRDQLVGVGTVDIDGEDSVLPGPGERDRAGIP